MAKTLSSTATFDLTRDQMIEQALHLIGVLHAAHIPDVHQLKLGQKFLNTGLMSLQADGVMLRLFDDYTQAITVGENEYEAAADTMSIEGYGAYVTSTDGIDSRLEPIFRHEYNPISDKAVTGSPAFLYARDSINPMKLILYPVPDSNWVSFTYVRQRKIRDVLTGSVHVDIPDKFLDAVSLNLAWKFAAHYKLGQQTIANWKGFYDQERDKVMNDDTPRGPMRFRATPIIGRDH